MSDKIVEAQKVRRTTRALRDARKRRDAPSRRRIKRQRFDRDALGLDRARRRARGRRARDADDDAPLGALELDRTTDETRAASRRRSTVFSIPKGIRAPEARRRRSRHERVDTRRRGVRHERDARERCAKRQSAARRRASTARRKRVRRRFRRRDGSASGTGRRTARLTTTDRRAIDRRHDGSHHGLE